MKSYLTHVMVKLLKKYHIKAQNYLFGWIQKDCVCSAYLGCLEFRRTVECIPTKCISEQKRTYKRGAHH